MLAPSQVAVIVLAAAISILAILFDLAAPPDPPRTGVWLNSGYKMPLVGLGTWKSKPGEVRAAVTAALDAGYRHIDCAHVYGNEVEVGEALNRTEVPRRELFITSKLWNTDHAPDRVVPAVKETLKNLGLAYLDLYLMHWPMGFQYSDGNLFPMNEDGSIKYDIDTHFTDTWKAMETLVKKRLVRSIGVSNFNATQLQEVIDAGEMKPSVNQVESHPFLNQKALLSACKSNSVVLTAYSPLGSPDRPWAKAGDPSLLQDPRIAAVAANYDKTPAQVLLRFQVQRNVVAIPKSVTSTRIKENAQIFDFELTKEDVDFLMTLETHVHHSSAEGSDQAGSTDAAHGFRACIPINKEIGAPRDCGHPLFPFRSECPEGSLFQATEARKPECGAFYAACQLEDSEMECVQCGEKITEKLPESCEIGPLCKVLQQENEALRKNGEDMVKKAKEKAQEEEEERAQQDAEKLW